MSFEVKSPSRNEWQDLLSFLNDELRPDQGWSIDKEYPLTLNPKNLENLRVVTEEGKIVSHVAMKPLVVKTPVGLFKVAEIGSVVTGKQHRGKGHSKAAMQSVLKLCDQHVCDFAILWSDLYDFYRGMGFELSGTEVATVIDHLIDLPPSELRFSAGNNVSPEAILKLYSRHTVGSIRTAADIANFLQIPNSQVFTAWGPDNQLEAFAVMGKGADLMGYIHEWGGNVSKLLPLFNHILQQTQQPITVISAIHSVNLVHQLKQHGFQQTEGFLGMIKVIRFENLFQKLNRYCKMTGVENIEFHAKPDDQYILINNEIYRPQNTRDWSQLIFGPMSKERLGLSDEQFKTLNSIFPLPMWIWGWDSI